MSEMLRGRLCARSSLALKHFKPIQNDIPGGEKNS